MAESLTHLYVLGPFELTQVPGHHAARPQATRESGQHLRRKTRALLAYLASTHEPARRESLAALFFSQSDDPLGALRWHLSEMRRRLGAASIIAQRNAVQLDHRL